jgi:hypothetical protein
MQSPHYRYFIELQPHSNTGLPRALEAESRRAAARGFIENIRGWLKERDLTNKVSELSVTMFGQVQIACDAAVIKFIRSQDNIDIAAIRQGAIHTENRWH